MSRRAELDQRLARLGEISDILTAMKNMALIETRKFSRFMAHQQRLVDSLGAATADFLHFFPTAAHLAGKDNMFPGNGAAGCRHFTASGDVEAESQQMAQGGGLALQILDRIASALEAGR